MLTIECVMLLLVILVFLCAAIRRDNPELIWAEVSFWVFSALTLAGFILVFLDFKGDVTCFLNEKFSPALTFKNTYYIIDERYLMATGILFRMVTYYFYMKNSENPLHAAIEIISILLAALFICASFIINAILFGVEPLYILMMAGITITLASILVLFENGYCKKAIKESTQKIIKRICLVSISAGCLCIFISLLRLYVKI